ncbi:hypothetical protein AGLY_017718 [Aphis glycines]|uniref:Uncharacterized protein n=1 Tax=Aphis glycines TaxID=307491 RepID=A0A6G0SW28_APHGL|nr:hypothetical protein AGLY_017718 [Aphis glycines]
MDLRLLTRLFKIGLNSANKLIVRKKFPSEHFSKDLIFPLCSLKAIFPALKPDKLDHGGNSVSIVSAQNNHFLLTYTRNNSRNCRKKIVDFRYQNNIGTYFCEIFNRMASIEITKRVGIVSWAGGAGPPLVPRPVAFAHLAHPKSEKKKKNSNSFKKNREKQKENEHFYAKLVFDQIDFLYGWNSKNNHVKFLRNISKSRKCASFKNNVSHMASLSRNAGM